MNSRTSRLRARLAALGLLLASTLLAQGADPDLPFQTVAYQGRLKVNGGVPGSSNRFDLRFHLFDSATGGSALDEAAVQGVTVDGNGLFTVLIDAHTPWSSVHAAHWVELDTRRSGSTSNYLTLAPRQRITAVPDALRAQSAAVAMAYTGMVSIAQLPADIARVDDVVRSLNGLKDNVLLSASDGLLLTPVGNELRLAALRSCGDYTNCYWSLLGNGNVTAGVNFLGTIAGELDPLEVRVNNNRALYILPAATPNLIGGFSGNVVAGGITGAHVGGGGEPGSVNVVSANYGIIGGGSGHGIYPLATYATIGGGNKNSVSTNSSYATVSGGDNNVIRPDSRYATIGGGQRNTIEPGAVFATISGGSQHSVGTNSTDGTIAGGSANAIARDTLGATISGGNLNSIQTGASSSAIGGGYQNTILPMARHGTIPGGRQGRAINYSQMAYASGAFANPGDAQFSLYVLRRTLTAAVTNELFLDGDAATQRLRIPAESTWTFDILVSARTDAGASAGYRVTGVIRNNAGATSLVGTPIKTVLGEDIAIWDVFVEADNVNDALAVKAYGVGTPVVPTRWVATVRTTEVVF